MQLKRVRVPNFKVLKDVDISFEPDLVPRIFPLGSINGGGKSTLLQLIFTLLHCPGEYERLPYLQNMLDDFTLDENSRYRDLANIKLIIDGEEIELDFFICDRDYIVLMDEVEIALHPDWQYGIINDLQTWAPNNQYILATHSYELCQALTPAHVKEIEPKLLKQQK
jgi:predicted ATP-binding protein involved in virulence